MTDISRPKARAGFSAVVEFSEAIDVLDFWSRACRQTQPGDCVRAENRHVQHWRHVDALAHRLGFVAVDDEDSMGLVWRNERHRYAACIGWVSKDDFDAWHQLFQVCFGHAMQEHFWQWKYRTTVSPGVGVWIDGNLIAFYGGMPRDVFHAGQSHRAIQVGDVMVHPAHRAGLTRAGPFQMAASTFLEQLLSVGAPYWLGFGFPNQRAMQVAKRLRLYRTADEVVELRWSLSCDAHPNMPWWLSVRPLTSIKKVQSAWQKMVGSMPGTLLGRRDQEYVQQRYVEHPVFSYQLLEIHHRLSRQLLGVVVLCRQPDQRIEVLDLIGHKNLMPLLVSAARQWSRAMGASWLFMWLTRSQQQWLAPSEPETVEIGVQIPTNDWVPGNALLDPSGRWWLTGGDTDFR